MFVGKKPRKGKRAPMVCGRTLCWAIAYWTAEEWAGRKRMAEALNAALTAATLAERSRTYVDPTGAVRYIHPALEAIDVEAMRRG
jgi:hypothetical protein